MNQQGAELRQQRLEINQAEMIERISRAVPEDGLLEEFPGVVLGRFSSPTERVYAVFKPSFCIIAQGSKQMLLGEELFRYDPGHYLISTVVLPVVANVVEASEERPYLGFQLHLDPAVVAAVMMDSGTKTKRSDASVKAMNVSPTDADLFEAALKLIRLLDTPEEIKFLAPLIIREIIYRLLRGEQGARLSHLLVSEGDTRRISRAVEQLRENLDQPLKIENMARAWHECLGLSLSL